MSRSAPPISLEQKISFCIRSDITLNGEPARIIGPRQQFAQVVQKAGGLGAQWSWEAVARICAEGGAFRS